MFCHSCARLLRKVWAPRVISPPLQLLPLLQLLLLLLLLPLLELLPLLPLLLIAF